jgi:hypothetical protein
MTQRTIARISAALLLASAPAFAGEGYQVLKNAGFEQEGPIGGAAFWTRGDPALVKFVTEDGNRFVRMVLPEKKAAIIHQMIELDPKWKALDLSVRIRAQGVQTGSQDWMTGQFQYLFADEDGKHVGGWQRLKVTADTGGWKTLRQKGLKIPDGAAKLKAQIGVWGAAGTFDFDEVQVLAASKPARPSTKVPEPFEPKGPVTRLDYYVAPDGSDDNDGRTLKTPFKTIQRAARAMHAGDTCHIRAGVYRETVTPAHSGQKGAPITFRPYKDEKVVVSGAEPITGWALEEGKVYKATMPADFFVSPHNQADQVFVNGRMMILAQWPNTSLDVSQPKKAVCSKFISKTRDKQRNMTVGVVEDDDLAPAEDGYYAGAEIFFQPNHGGWSWAFTGTVVKQEGGRLTFETRSSSGKDFRHHVYADKSRYVLYNLRKLLDAPGEWYHDTDAGVLYLRMPDGGDPAKATVEAKKRDHGFVLDGLAYITIRGVELFACDITTDLAAGGHGRGYDEAGKVIYPWRPKKTFAKSHHVTIDGIKAKYLSHFTDRSGHFFLQWGQGTGIVLSGQDHVLRNSVLRYSSGNGVSVLGARHKVLNNLILDTGYGGTDCHAVSFTGTATSVDCEVGYNTVRRTGRTGVQITGLKNSDPTKALLARAHHNDIADFAIQDWDTGAIRATGSGEFTRIDHNLCHDAWENVDNIPNVGAFTASGVYLDYGSNWIVDHNVTWNVEWGIHLQAADTKKPEANILVYNNTVGVKPFGDPPPPYGPFGIWVNNPPAKHPGSVVRNNIIFCVNATKYYKPLPTEPRRKKAWQAADNLLWDGKPGSKNDPKFADLAAGKLWLEAGSPAIDAGKMIRAYERDGVTVPPFNLCTDGKPDLGAYEHGVRPWQAGCDLSEGGEEGAR